MSKSSLAASALPGAARQALIKIGEDLKLARRRRKWSLREASSRLFISIPTLIRLEAGAPGVAVGVLAHALFLYGLVDRLSWLADPRFDAKALVEERRQKLGAKEAHFDV